MSQRNPLCSVMLLQLTAKIVPNFWCSIPQQCWIKILNQTQKTSRCSCTAWPEWTVFIRKRPKFPWKPATVVSEMVMCFAFERLGGCKDLWCHI